MRDITQQERAAMWLYHNEYAAQAEGAIEFYKRLSASDKRNVQQMIDDIVGGFCDWIFQGGIVYKTACGCRVNADPRISGQNCHHCGKPIRLKDSEPEEEGVTSQTTSTPECTGTNEPI